jgi:hypothetical protein
MYLEGEAFAAMVVCSAAKPPAGEGFIFERQFVIRVAFAAPTLTSAESPSLTNRSIGHARLRRACPVSAAETRSISAERQRKLPT